MANHHVVRTADAALIESVDATVYLPPCIQEDYKKNQLTSIAYSIRHHINVLQTSAAKICHEVFRAKLIFGKDGHEDFVAFALANFFPRGQDGSIVDSESSRRRIRLWAQNGKLIDDYFQKNGGDFDQFKQLTMAALTSLSGAPEDIVSQALANPDTVVAADINAQVQSRKALGSAVTSELMLVDRQVSNMAASDALLRAEEIADDLRSRLRIMQEASINRDREIEESAAELNEARRLLEAARNDLKKAVGSKAVTSARVAVESVERNERALAAKVESLKRQGEDVQRRLENMNMQLQSTTSIVATLNQLRDDIGILLAKYPSALIAKLDSSDKRVRPILKDIARGLHALGDQIEVEA